MFARFVARTLRRHAGRAVALMLGVVVATSGVVLLTTVVESSRAEIIGTVQENARSAYDVLVRPAGSASELERSEGLVQDNHLSGLFGGITLEAYQRIRDLPGVAAAAPVANLGYAHVMGVAYADLSAYLDELPALIRVDPVYVAANGLARYPDAPRYVYVTDQPFDAAGPRGDLTVQPDGGVQRWPCWHFNVDRVGMGVPPTPNRVIPAEALGTMESPFDPFARTALECYSTASPTGTDPLGNRPEGFLGVSVPVAFPVLIAAIDPEQEEALAGLGGAVTQGRYLRTGEEPQIEADTGVRSARVPMLLSTEAFADVELELGVNVLDVNGEEILPHLDGAGARSFVTGLAGQPAGVERVDLAEAFGDIPSGLLTFGLSPGGGVNFNIGNLWTTGAVSYERTEAGLTPTTLAAQPDDTWQSLNAMSRYDPNTPVDNQATQVRPVTPLPPEVCGMSCWWATPEVVGRFDPQRIAGYSELSRVPLETYRSPEVVAADDATRELLGDEPLRPDRNLGGYLRQPPALLTNLESIDEILASRQDAQAQAEAPISSIRIRVAGVTGVDELSRARINAVVADIQEILGDTVEVDITLGSSPAPQRVLLPAGLAGPSPLTVQEYWAEKGVGFRIVEAVEAKSLALLALVLVVCTLYVAQGAVTAVRSRRAELATLLALGWSRRSVFGAVGLEVLVIGVAGGITGALAAWIIGGLAGLGVSAGRAALAVPAAVAIALLAGVIPAWRASRVPPIEALRPPVVAARRASRVRSTLALAAVNTLRGTGRTALAASGLAVAVAGLAVLLGVTIGFRGQVTGTLLGAVVVAEVTTVDFVAVALSLLLGVVTLVDVLLMNQRERAPEYATLAATGWTSRELARLAATEGLLIALVGGLAGAALGAGVCAALGASFLTAQTMTGVLSGTLAAVAGSVLVAMLALGIPVRRIATIPPSRVLAEE